jgi:glycosyltransferase involved in cell wall biosynthesis
MPRLLILCEYPTLLGGERSMLATLRVVAAAGFDLAVVAPANGPLADTLCDMGFSHIVWQTRDAAGDRCPLDRLRTDLAGIIRDARPDLLHANSLLAARIAGPVAAACGLPSIGHLRDIIRLTAQAVADLNRHVRLLAVSRATRDFHVRQGVDAAKCFVANNGVDLNVFRPRPPSGYLHRELNLPAEARLIAVIGQLGLRKGTDVALNAAARVAEPADSVHWLIVGERTSNKVESREFEAALHSLAAESPLAGRVHFVGARSDISALMNECTLLVHAARQEPLGRVLLEAAASGLAAVATDVGGTREIFPEETDGAVLVAPDEVSSLASAVRSLVEDDALRQLLAAAARRRAEMAFDIRSTAGRLIDHYRFLLT